MASISKSKVVPYSAAKMFDLVNKVEDYPEFIPACHASEVKRHGDDEIHATLHFAKGGIQKSFTTCNRLQKNKMIEIRLLNGPFSHLEGFWRFETLSDGGCKIMLDLEFEFASFLLGVAFGPVFHQVATTLVDAFCDRAVEVYGED